MAYFAPVLRLCSGSFLAAVSLHRLAPAATIPEVHRGWSHERHTASQAAAPSLQRDRGFGTWEAAMVAGVPTRFCFSVCQCLAHLSPRACFVMCQSASLTGSTGQPAFMPRANGSARFRPKLVQNKAAVLAGLATAPNCYHLPDSDQLIGANREPTASTTHFTTARRISMHGLS